MRHLVLLNENDEFVLVQSFTHDQHMKAVESRVAMENLVEFLKRQAPGNEDGSTVMK